MPTDYTSHVEHPRLGKSPRFTGLDPNPDSPGVHLHWNTGFWTEAQLGLIGDYLRRLLVLSGAISEGSRCLIFGTAILADLDRQTKAAIPVTHYYDLDRACRDCGRRFLFFAAEQRHWYEELGFPLESDCVRCHLCRRVRRIAARRKQRYDELLHRGDRTVDESIELADCCLHLIEGGDFKPRRTQRVRELLNQIAQHGRSHDRCNELKIRVLSIEGKGS